MRLIRRHLGAWSAAWLSWQVATLFVLLPAVSPLAGLFGDGTTVCLESTMPAECPMRAEEGEACPMHSNASAADQSAKDECAMRATTTSPMMALASMFVMPGVLVSASALTVDDGAAILSATTDSVPSAFSSLDSPPPRS